MMKKNSSCPCSSNKLYIDCCKIAHSDLSKVETAEQLMRSRYTAFTQGNGDYLMLSHHSDTCPYHDKDEIVNWANSVTWSRLEIINFTKGQPKDLEGFVEFKAYFNEGFKEKFIHENSKFVKENNNWVYLEAVL